MSRQAVTVIGLGPMGRAMVHVLMDHGHPVTVWNRTPAKAEALVARGAVAARTVAEALAASELIVLSLTDYKAMYDILGPEESGLSGRVIVNLSSDTPENSRKAAAWLDERGAQLLVGGVMVPEYHVGKEGAYVFYSGPRALFDAHEPTLRRIGRADYMGADHGLAQLFYQAQLDIVLTSLSGYLHATALVGSAGVSARRFLPYAIENLDAISSYLEGAADAIDEGRHIDDGASVIMMGATAAHIYGASEEAGIDLGLPAAVKALYDRAIAAGRGREGWTSLIEGIRHLSRTTGRTESVEGAAT